MEWFNGKKSILIEVSWHKLRTLPWYCKYCIVLIVLMAESKGSIGGAKIKSRMIVSALSICRMRRASIRIPILTGGSHPFFGDADAKSRLLLGWIWLPVTHVCGLV